MEKELAAVREQPKEQRLEYFFRYGGYGGIFLIEDLNLTGKDVDEYQRRKDAEISMKPAKKRDAVIRQVIKPLLKTRGFQSVRNSWWKELEDCWLFIYLKNSRWNSTSSGATFSFQISVSGKEEIKGELSEQWIHNQFTDLCQRDFLPYCGYLSPRMKAGDYHIDGNRNGLPLDEPLEDIMEQIRGDFENYILPCLDQLRTKKDWDILYREKHAAVDAEAVRLLRYYSCAHMDSCAESNMHFLIQTQQDFKLTPEIITSHFDWLETIIQNSDQTFRDTKAYILRSLEI